MGSVLTGDQGGFDGLAPRWQLVDLADIQVAVQGEGKGAGDGGGGQGEDVGMAALLGEAGPLLDAEAVLLVNHHQTQGGKLHRVFNQGVGAHHQGQFPRRQGSKKLPPFGGPG